MTGAIKIKKKIIFYRVVYLGVENGPLECLGR